MILFQSFKYFVSHFKPNVWILKTNLILRKKIVFFLIENFALEKVRSESGRTFWLGSVSVDPHAPDRFTPSRARCAEKCGSALTHR